MKIGYQCEVCGHKTLEVEMRPKYEGEDIAHFVHACVRVICFDHSMSKPLCTAKAVDLYIPITQSGIGVEGPELTEEDRRAIDKILKS